MKIMILNSKSLAAVLATTAGNWFRPSFLRAIAQASLDWRQLHCRQPLITVMLQDLTAEPQEICLRVNSGVYGDTSQEDLLALCTLARVRRPKTVFEFGTYRGNATVHLAMNVPSDSRIYTLDIPPQQRGNLQEATWDKTVEDHLIGEVYRASPFAAQITQIYADSRAFDPASCPDKMDFIFIDACHEYEFVASDSRKAFEMLSEDGILCWHDYSRAHPGVCKYLEELAACRDVYHVYKTNIAFCRGQHQPAKSC